MGDAFVTLKEIAQDNIQRIEHLNMLGGLDACVAISEPEFHAVVVRHGFWFLS